MILKQAFRIFLAVVGASIGLVLTLPALLLALPFIVMSLAVRFAPRITEPEVAHGPSDSRVIRFDPDLGWRPHSRLDTWYQVQRDDIYRVITDSEGWPRPLSVEESQMVVVGDSFAYGYGARAGEVFWDHAGDLLIKPVGCAGYDLVQELEALRSLGSRLAGKLVVWFVYLENDLPDCLRPQWRGYRKPFVRRTTGDGPWEVVLQHIREEKWTHSLDRNNTPVFAEICGPGPFSDRYYAAGEFVLAEGAEICREAGAALVITTIPAKAQLEADGLARFMAARSDPAAFDPDYPDARVEEICKRLGLPFIPMKGFLEAADYKEFEGFHWNPRGHRKAGALLRDLYADWKADRLKTSDRDARVHRG